MANKRNMSRMEWEGARAHTHTNTQNGTHVHSSHLHREEEWGCPRVKRSNSGPTRPTTHTNAVVPHDNGKTTSPENTHIHVCFALYGVGKMSTHHYHQQQPNLASCDFNKNITFWMLIWLVGKKAGDTLYRKTRTQHTHNPQSDSTRASEAVQNGSQ